MLASLDGQTMECNGPLGRRFQELEGIARQGIRDLGRHRKAVGGAASNVCICICICICLRSTMEKETKPFEANQSSRRGQCPGLHSKTMLTASSMQPHPPV